MQSAKVKGEAAMGTDALVIVFSTFDLCDLKRMLKGDVEVHC